MSTFLKLISKRIRALALFLLEVQALSAYVWLSVAHPPFGRGGAILFLPVLAALTLFLGAVLALASGRAVRALAARTGEDPAKLAASLVLSLSPLVLLDLVFVQYAIFLRDIRTVLVPVSILGTLYLLAVFLLRLRASHPEVFPSRVRQAFEKIEANPGSTARKLAGISFLAYAFLASGLVFPPQPFTGDEPHYLVITRSLLRDGDIDLFNNYRDKDYLAFYPGPLRSHAYPGKRGPEHVYSKHLPGTSVLVLPSYFAGELAGRIFAGGPAGAGLRSRIFVFAARLTMCLLSALLGAALYLVAIRLTGRAAPSLAAWAVFCFMPPMIFHSQLVYPEVPAALILIFVFDRISLRNARSTGDLLLAGAGIAVLPWFGVKYVMLSAGLFLLGMPAIFRPGPRRWSRFLSLTFLPFLSGLGYLGYFWALYGRLDPMVVYTGTVLMPDPLKFEPGILAKAVEIVRFGVGYLFDQRSGILPYAPVYVLFIAGSILLLKTRKKAALSLLFLMGSFWLLCSTTGQWGGYCPPGRLVLPVAWIMAVFVAAAFVGERGTAGRSVLAVAIGAGILAAYAGLRTPWILYHVDLHEALAGAGTSSHLLTSLGNALVDPTAWVPDLAGPENLKAPVLGVWLLAAALVTFIFVKRKHAGTAAKGPMPLGVHAAIVFALSMAVVGYAFSDIRLKDPLPSGSEGVEVFFQDDNAHGAEAGGFWTKAGRETTVLLRSSRPLSRINLSLASPVPGRTTVRVATAERTARRVKRNGPASIMEFPRPVGFRWGSGHYYCLRVGDSSGFVPREIDRNVPDARRLGVFITLDALF